MLTDDVIQQRTHISGYIYYSWASSSTTCHTSNLPSGCCTIYSFSFPLNARVEQLGKIFRTFFLNNSIRIEEDSRDFIEFKIAFYKNWRFIAQSDNTVLYRQNQAHVIAEKYCGEENPMLPNLKNITNLKIRCSSSYGLIISCNCCKSQCSQLSPQRDFKTY